MTGASSEVPRGGRARWLVPGGVMAAVIVGVFAATMALRPVVSTVGIAVTAAWFAAMVLCGLAIHDRRAHSRIQMALMVTMALIAAALLLVIFLWPA